MLLNTVLLLLQALHNASLTAVQITTPSCTPRRGEKRPKCKSDRTCFFLMNFSVKNEQKAFKTACFLIGGSLTCAKPQEEKSNNRSSEPLLLLQSQHGSGGRKKVSQHQPSNWDERLYWSETSTEALLY